MRISFVWKVYILESKKNYHAIRSKRIIFMADCERAVKAGFRVLLFRLRVATVIYVKTLICNLKYLNDFSKKTYRSFGGTTMADWSKRLYFLVCEKIT